MVGAAMALCTMLALTVAEAAVTIVATSQPQQRDAAPTAVDKGREIFRFETFATANNPLVYLLLLQLPLEQPDGDGGDTEGRAAVVEYLRSRTTD